MKCNDRNNTQWGIFQTMKLLFSQWHLRGLLIKTWARNITDYNCYVPNVKKPCQNVLSPLHSIWTILASKPMGDFWAARRQQTYRSFFIVLWAQTCAKNVGNNRKEPVCFLPTRGWKVSHSATTKNTILSYTLKCLLEVYWK